jgi:integrin beta 3
MANFDGKAFGAEIVSVVKDYMAREMGPVIARLDALEKRQPEKGERGEPGTDGKDGAPGKDADPVSAEQIVEAVRSMPEAIAEAVAKYLSDNPPPAGKDGRDGADGKDGEPGADGRDGLDVKDLFRADGGRLVAVMSDGTTKDLGVFVGKDGEPGEKGADGRDGADGKDGRDGFGFEDLDLVETETGVMLRFMRGEEVKEFRLPIVIDRGVYDSEKTYLKGDGTTWGGCFWIAQKDNPEGKPDSGNGWRMAVKKGRDGRNGEVKADKPVKVKV